MKKDTKEWIKFVENSSKFDVECITFNELRESDWGWNTEGNIQHKSGKFYTIEGIQVKTNGIEWEQPIINQPELGILGILMRLDGDQREYYLQLKAEPGNINKYQLSPTVQATRSNYSRVHEGKETKYLEYFVNNTGAVVDRLQTEQGGRFFRKRNRNIVVPLFDSNVPLVNYPEKYFRWFDSHEIRDMLREDNIINMDARSVLSCDWASRKLNYDFPIYTMNDLLNWFNRMKFENTLETKLIPLAKVKNWTEDNMEIHDKEMKHFGINAVKVNTDNREVSKWSQPMIFEKNQGLVGFITTFINEQRHYLIHARIEPGSMDKMYVAPSVQCSNYNYKETLPRFADILLESNIKLYDSIQSEEGGRFYHFQNRHLIVEVNGFDWEDIPDDYMWATSEQLKDFINYGLLNIEARSLMTGYLFR